MARVRTRFCSLGDVAEIWVTFDRPGNQAHDLRSNDNRATLPLIDVEVIVEQRKGVRYRIERPASTPLEQSFDRSDTPTRLSHTADRTGLATVADLGTWSLATIPERARGD